MARDDTETSAEAFADLVESGNTNLTLTDGNGKAWRPSAKGGWFAFGPDLRVEEEIDAEQVRAEIERGNLMIIQASSAEIGSTLISATNSLFVKYRPGRWCYWHQSLDTIMMESDIDVQHRLDIEEIAPNEPASMDTNRAAVELRTTDAVPLGTKIVDVEKHREWVKLTDDRWVLLAHESFTNSHPVTVEAMDVQNVLETSRRLEWGDALHNYEEAEN